MEQSAPNLHMCLGGGVHGVANTAPAAQSASGTVNAVGDALTCRSRTAQGARRRDSARTI